MKLNNKKKNKATSKEKEEALTKKRVDAINRPDGVIISIRPVIEYVVDVHRYSHSKTSGKASWSSWVRKGNFTTPEFALETAKYVEKAEGKNCDLVEIEDLSHTGSITETPISTTRYHQILKERQAKEDKANRKKIENSKPAKPVLTINESEVMLKARKKLRKKLRNNR